MSILKAAAIVVGVVVAVRIANNLIAAAAEKSKPRESVKRPSYRDGHFMWEQAEHCRHQQQQHHRFHH